jgi:prepilin-type processing-associated H-X9-DG protein
MPEIYRTPGSAAAKEHKTGYLTIRGKDMMFPAGEKLAVQHIKDGLSNTAMIVEVDDERAVTWTKPDDFEPAGDDPLKGLLIRNGKIHVLFGDGSVHTLSDSINKENLRAIYTRAGGESVNLNN